jgi:hypothetical protein
MGANSAVVAAMVIGLGPARTTTLGLRVKPFAYPPPTSQRLLLAAPGCRLSGDPGYAVPNTTETLKVVPFDVGSLNHRAAITRPGVESNPYRIGVIVVGPDLG